MLERQSSSIDALDPLDTGTPVPAARPLSDFCIERVGDDVVLFDATRNRYHTLNGVAYEVWRLCDGSRSIVQIGLALDRGDALDESISAAVAQLGESGLLEAPETEFESTLHRRKMMKLVAAGAIGTVGIPVVASITRLGPEASASHNPCGSPCGPNNCCCFNSGNNTYSCASVNGCTNSGRTCHQP